MASNVKSLSLTGNINITDPDNTTGVFYPNTSSDRVELTSTDKENVNIAGKESVSDVIGSLGKLAFKDEVNLDGLELNVATPTEDGLMSAEDKQKLDTIPDVGFFVDNELSETSENPVQNKVITNALKNVEIVVDDSLNEESVNPVQNKVITSEIRSKVGYSLGPIKPETPGTIWIELK